MEEVLIPIVLFGMIFGIVYVITSARHKEKMAMIESGANPELFRSKFTFNQYDMFKWGLFLVGIALGIITGNILADSGAIREEVAFPAMIFFFGGLSLITSFLLKDKLNKEK